MKEFKLFLTFMKAIPKMSKEVNDLTGKKDRLRNDDGSTRDLFLYQVKGDKDAIEKYLELQCEQSGKEESTFKNADGKVLYFTEFALPFPTGKLLITTTGKIVVDNSAVAIAQSLLRQFPGAVGIMLAKEHLKTTKSTETVDSIMEEANVDQQ